ncbi:sensor domain-containing diguanylate cyclase [Catenovulum agarivorans]|uniref:sensor domain-containing diguanylate cyclase n=1 Tax=Catenovulum agarivorans TaxID=1172192 RepID=UPI0002D9A4AE|nr:sensor domain-containing diguanylate cyclase [Catenovulum agarivorans]
MNTKNRALTLVSIFLLVGFIAVSTLSYWSARHTLSEQIVSEVVPLTGISIYSKIKEKLMAPIHISSLMAQDTFVHDWVHNGEQEASKMQRYLAEIQQRNNAITSFFVSEKTRNYYHPNGVLKQVSEHDAQDNWYFSVTESTQDYIVNIDLDTRDLQSLTVFINYKVIDSDGLYLGAIGIGLSVTSVKQLLDDNNLHQQFFIFFADEQGQVMLQSNNYLFDKQPIKTLEDITGLAAYKSQLLSSENSTTRFNFANQSAHVNSRYVPELGWSLMILHTDKPWDKRIIQPLLLNLSIGLLISILVIAVVFYTMRRYQKELERMAITDKLTGVANRHGFEHLVNRLFSHKNKKCTCSVILFDLDNFKQINDTYTHLAGDKVICDAVAIVQGIYGKLNTLVRWGGEEFLLILPNQDAHAAAAIAEKIRQTIEQNVSLFDKQSIRFTASFGVSQWQYHENVDQFLLRLDKALYSAKQQGKNQVCVE